MAPKFSHGVRMRTALAQPTLSPGSLRALKLSLLRVEPIDPPLRLIDRRTKRSNASGDSVAETALGGVVSATGCQVRPIDSRGGNVSDFVFDPDQWAMRADVAREAAEELGKLAAGLNGVVASNYFGRGCDEGEALFGALTASVRSGVEELDSLARSARSLAAQTSAGSGAIQAGDEGAGGFIG